MPPDEKPVLERARAEIAAGRLWKARERLAGVIRFDRYDQKVLDLLGEVHFSMGDLPAAGRLWFLTERIGHETESAHAALQERYGNDPALILESIPFGRDLERYPVSVRSRLDELVAQAGKRGQRLLKSRRRARYRHRGRDSGSTLGRGAGCLVVAFLLGVLALGFIELFLLLLGRSLS
ncbi:MAG: DUF6584 family protein [Gaiellaceae bacterium]